MYARINIPDNYVAAPRVLMTQLLAAIDAANSAHAFARNTPSHIAADKILQQELANIESRISGDDYKERATMRNALTSVRDAVRARLIAAGELPQPAGEPETSLSRMIAKLPDAAAERLARILVEYRSNQAALNVALQALFPNGDMSHAAKQWRAYLGGPPQHTITYLGGANIINFKVSTVPAGMEPSEVLKLEYRFGYARRMDTVVRESVPGLLTPTAAARMVLAPEKNAADPLTGRSLMVTTLCAHGGADGYAERLRRAAAAPGGSATKFALEAQDIILQMCTALQKLEANNIYFPDAKLSNWVVDAPHILQIADTKSFLRSPPAHINLAHPDNCGKEMTLATRGYVSKEVFNNLATPTQIHSAILGRNIYNFLTGVNPDDVRPPLCTEPFFSSPAGEVYKTLITDLTRNPAHTRITPAEAGERLRMIELKLDPRYTAIKAKIRSLGILIGKDHSHFLSASLRAACTDPGYNKETVLLTLDEVVSRALMSAQAADASYAVVTKTKPLFSGKELLPIALLKADKEANLAAAVDLQTLAAGLATHASHLQTIEAALPNFTALQRLANECKALSFGGDDAVLKAHLEAVKLDIFKKADLSERFAGVERAHARLAHVMLHSPVMEQTRQVLRALNAIEVPYLQAIAKQHAVVLDNVAALVPLAMRGDPAAHMVVPEVKALHEALVTANLLLLPDFQKLFHKIKELEVLTGKDHSHFLLASLRAACTDPGYNKETVLLALDEVVSKALMSAQAAEASYAVVTQTKPLFSGKEILPAALLTADKEANLAAAVDLQTLATGLATHASHLQTIEAALPNFTALQELANECKALGFGGDDAVLKAHLDAVKLEIFKEADLSRRFAGVKKAHARLADTQVILHSPVMEQTHQVLKDLNAIEVPYLQAVAKQHAVVLETVAALVPLAMRGDPAANMAVPEVKALHEALVTSNLMLLPDFQKLFHKIKELEVLTGQDKSACLFASIQAAGTDMSRAALLALNEVADKALASAQSVAASRKAILAPSQCVIGRHVLLPEDLLLADWAKCIATAHNLEQLAEGLAEHAIHMEVTQTALPHLKKLNGLANLCRSQRFGDDRDLLTLAYLREAGKYAMKGEDLLTRLANADAVRAELIVMCEGLQRPGLQEIHRVIQDLRNKHTAWADKKANGIEAAIIDVPVNQRANLIAHLREPKVRLLFDTLAWNNSGFPAADRMSIEEYRKVMNAINLIEPDDPVPDLPAPRMH